MERKPNDDRNGKNIPVTYLINPAVKIFRSKIERNIDDAIEKAMDFKPVT
jgi:hypothetical protein